MAPEMEMRYNPTPRYFDAYTFKDRSGHDCRLQKSSLATEDAIWLGTNKNMMHLTRDQVRDLLPQLIYFVMSGELKQPD